MDIFAIPFASRQRQRRFFVFIDAAVSRVFDIHFSAMPLLSPLLPLLLA